MHAQNLDTSRCFTPLKTTGCPCPQIHSVLDQKVLIITRTYTTQEHATVAIRNLSVHDECEAKVVTEGALPPLIYLLRHEIKAVQEQAVGALRNLSVIPENKNRIAKEGGVPPLILLLKSNVDKIQELAACTVHNLSAGRCVLLCVLCLFVVCMYVCLYI
jgi:hypothetical protein